MTDTTARETGLCAVSPKFPFLTRQNIKEGIVALSVANWIFIRTWSNLLSITGRYFSKQPVVRVELLALVSGMLGFALIVWAGIAVSRRFSGPVASAAFDLAFLALLIFPFDYFRTQANLTGSQLIRFARHPLGLLCLLAIAATVVYKHRLTARGAAIVAGITSPLAIFNISKIALMCLGVVHAKDCACAAPAPAILPVRQRTPRVVWMIFDETDYRLAFVQRPPGVKLPEFDRLQKISLSANEAYPPGSDTAISMPALITGWRLSSIEHEDCDLVLNRDDTGAKSRWSVSPSVFSLARNLGFNTALVGWYLPYTCMLGASLNYCSWYPNPVMDAVSSATFGGSIHQQMASLVQMRHVRQLYIDACNGNLRDSLSVVANGSYGLVLLHLPPPHDPPVYLPDKKEFTVTEVTSRTSYFNNLALADRELGSLRAAIEKSGQKKNTWIILSADHSWRKSKIFDGHRDYRVPYIVDCPSDDAPIDYSRQFNTVVTRDLILSILRGEVTNQPSVAAWLDIHGKPELPVLKHGEAFE
jgi:hypothetical protein